MGPVACSPARPSGPEMPGEPKSMRIMPICAVSGTKVTHARIGTLRFLPPGDNLATAVHPDACPCFVPCIEPFLTAAAGMIDRCHSPKVEAQLNMFLLSMAKRLLTQPQRDSLRRHGSEFLASAGLGNLNQLARVHGTDKWGKHWYTQHYQRYFASWRRRSLKILEIGVGGYDDTSEGAHSLRMWKSFFPNAQVVGIDLFDKSGLSEPRIDVLQCDQTDAKRLGEISARYGGFDIVIDDGSHLNQHVIETFNILFPLLKSPGFYCIEDLQTAYWPGWGAVPGATSMDYLQQLTHCVNQAERPGYTPNAFDLSIVEIAFFHNLCILRKEPNLEAASSPKAIAQELELMQASRGIKASA